jgi:hypothetical protein
MTSVIRLHGISNSLERNDTRHWQQFLSIKSISIYLGFRSTRITLSPRKNILLMNRSLLTAAPCQMP